MKCDNRSEEAEGRKDEYYEDRNAEYNLGAKKSLKLFEELYNWPGSRCFMKLYELGTNEGTR